MVDLKALQQEIEEARRVRREVETAGLDLEHLIDQMRSGRSLQQIELDAQAAD